MSDSRVRPYPTDLSDAEWSVLEPLLPAPARTGRPLKWSRRLMAEAIFYLVRSGCAQAAGSRATSRPGRRFTPSSLAGGRTARFAACTTACANGPARPKGGWPSRARRSSARRPRGQPVSAGPSAATMLPRRPPAASLVDAAGLVLLAHVHAADVPDRTGAKRLIETAPLNALPRLELLWADGAYTGSFARWLAEERGWRIERPHHRQRQAWRYGLEEKPKGFQVIPRRWVVERTFAWLSRSRRLARDYERLPETGEAMIHAAMSRIMLRRVAA